MSSSTILSKTRLRSLAGSVIMALALAVAPVLSDVPSSNAVPPQPDFALSGNTALELATKVNELVTTKFFDNDVVDKVWKPAFEAEKASLSSEKNLLDFSAKMNRLLKLLHSSHTEFMTENDEIFFFLRSLFGAFHQDEKDPKKNDADFVGLGVGGVHAATNQVRYVLEGSPAAAAGFVRGDVIVSVNGRPYTGYANWYQTSGKCSSVVVNRSGKKIELKVTPRKQDFLAGYVDAITKSARVIPFRGRRIGYIHLWSGGLGSQDAFRDEFSKTLLNTDALILDLRDGYGGTSPEHMDLFFRPPSAFPDSVATDRKGSQFDREYYNKPVALLINGGVRSDKELMANGFKRSHRAKLYGETTAGYVVAGQFNQLEPRAILYLAVKDIKVAGQRLEGKGVPPDVFVKDELGQSDPVLTRALHDLCAKNR